jgi:hypothetical protein
MAPFGKELDLLVAKTGVLAVIGLDLLEIPV